MTTWLLKRLESLEQQETDQDRDAGSGVLLYRELAEVLERLDEQSRQEAEDIALPVAHRCTHCQQQAEHMAME